MNILILGSGGREHALAWKIKQSPLCSGLFIAPGNAGTSQCGENINIDVNDFAAIKDFCIKENIEIVVVGPEDPLVNGICDFLQAKEASPLEEVWRGIVIGPSAAGAQLEGSKSFSKHFMQRHNITTAAYAEFNELNYQEGKQYISQHSLPIVLKADGLAAGKGVIICNTYHEALEAFEEMIVNKQFGKASAKVVIEEFLQGIEVSVFVLTDGVDYKIIGHAKDYKRIGEGDTGLNTGGMGCVSPVPFVNDTFMAKVEERIIKPTIKGLQTEQLEYKGFVFIGLMNVNGEPYVIEYNCRMGDPETEVVMPRFKNDIVEMFVALHNGELDKVGVEFDERAAATIVAVSAGYPGKYEKNKPIRFPAPSEGLGEAVLIFHSGIKQVDDKIVTNGGRVLAVTAFGENIGEAVKKSLSKLEEISFEGMYYRKDIGYEFKA
ncbi:MAG: phosphoribosylamine--glycine ligase [Segetibacter sp.]|nr:phosphoribosylamine--glycine ligase [Segetibacter sp.]